jgi:hypothetical protein
MVVRVSLPHFSQDPAANLPKQSESLAQLKGVDPRKAVRRSSSSEAPASAPLKASDAKAETFQHHKVRQDEYLTMQPPAKVPSSGSIRDLPPPPPTVPDVPLKSSRPELPPPPALPPVLPPPALPPPVLPPPVLPPALPPMLPPPSIPQLAVAPPSMPPPAVAPPSIPPPAVAPPSMPPPALPAEWTPVKAEPPRILKKPSPFKKDEEFGFPDSDDERSRSINSSPMGSAMRPAADRPPSALSKTNLMSRLPEVVSAPPTMSEEVNVLPVAKPNKGPSIQPKPTIPVEIVRAPVHTEPLISVPTVPPPPTDSPEPVRMTAARPSLAAKSAALLSQGVSSGPPSRAPPPLEPTQTRGVPPPPPPSVVNHSNDDEDRPPPPDGKARYFGGTSRRVSVEAPAFPLGRQPSGSSLSAAVSAAITQAMTGSAPKSKPPVMPKPPLSAVGSKESIQSEEPLSRQSSKPSLPITRGGSFNRTGMSSLMAFEQLPPPRKASTDLNETSDDLPDALPGDDDMYHFVTVFFDSLFTGFLCQTFLPVCWSSVRYHRLQLTLRLTIWTSLRHLMFFLLKQARSMLCRG